MEAIRYQKPAQAGRPSLRSGVFYLPVNDRHSGCYRLGVGDPVPGGLYGGHQRVRRTFRASNPLVVDGSCGGLLLRYNALAVLLGPEAPDRLTQELAFLQETDSGLLPAEARAALLPRIEAVLARYDAPPLGRAILECSVHVGQILTAVLEGILAEAARRRGHDAIVGIDRDNGRWHLSELFDLREKSYPRP